MQKALVLNNDVQVLGTLNRMPADSVAAMERVTGDLSEEMTDGLGRSEVVKFTTERVEVRV